jgi:hypothetical protein
VFESMLFARIEETREMPREVEEWANRLKD